MGVSVGAAKAAYSPRELIRKNRNRKIFGWIGTAIEDKFELGLRLSRTDFQSNGQANGEYERGY